MVTARPGAFSERLRELARQRGGALCVGLDPVAADLPAHLGAGDRAVRRYCLELIEATSQHACAFKPNTAFFEVQGATGWALLREVVAAAGRQALVVVDGKRGDIGHTARAYAQAVFDELGADACTVNGYLGQDSVAPFISRPDRLAFVVCRTSNPGAGDLQDLIVGRSGNPLYMELALLARSWNVSAQAPTVGLVAGATWPQELARIREAAPELPLLIPGVGAQGGDLEAAVRAAHGLDRQGVYLLNVSRAVGGASRGADFAEAAAAAAATFVARMQDAISAVSSSPEHALTE